MSIVDAILGKVLALAEGDKRYAQQAYACTLPTSLGWDSAVFPLGTITLNDLPDGNTVGSCGMSAKSLFDSFSTARTAPGSDIYVNPAGSVTLHGVTFGAGNDSTGNGTAAAPYATFTKAVAVGNAAGLPTRYNAIRSLPAFARGNNFSAGGSVQPTTDFALIAHGRINMGTYDQISTGSPPALDATYTNCYTITIATAGNVDKVVDLNSVNARGNYAEMVNVATPARCNITPGSWCISGTTLYINRLDGAAVIAGNTRYYRPSAIVKLSAHVNAYIGGFQSGDGFDFEGGQTGCIDTSTQVGSQTTDKVFCVENCSMKYTGGLVSNVNGRSVAMDSFRGLAFFEQCHFSAALTDLFNVHNGAGNPRIFALTLNCTGYDAGRPGQASNNGHTGHENVVCIDIAGKYESTRGGAIRYVNSSKAYYAGTKVLYDLGDLSLGSASAGIGPTAFQADDTAELWCERTAAIMQAGSNAYVASVSTAKIHKRNCVPTLATDRAVGTIDNVWT